MKIYRQIILPANNTDILQFVKNKFTQTCSKNDGYILDIEDYKIISNRIVEHGAISLELELTATTLKPDINQTYTGEVCMLFEHGFFVEIKNCLKVLIPINKLKNYSFNKDCFVSKKNKISLKDTLQIKIEMIRYDNGYECLGCLV